MQEEHLHPNQRALSFFTDHFELFCVQLVNSDEPTNENSLGRLLLSATYLNDLVTVTAVLKVDPTLLKDYGHLAVIIAAGMGYYDLVKLLHESHPEWFNSSLFLSSHFLCPFEFAAMRQHQKIVEFLLPHITKTCSIDPVLKQAQG